MNIKDNKQELLTKIINLKCLVDAKRRELEHDIRGLGALINIYENVFQYTLPELSKEGGIEMFIFDGYNPEIIIPKILSNEKPFSKIIKPNIIDIKNKEK